MHSLAWVNLGDKREALEAIAKCTPGQRIDLTTPPDLIIADIKSQPDIQWP
jgi:hypothetical protein